VEQDEKQAKILKFKPEYKKTTVAKLGPKLPLGILGPDKTYQRDIAVRPWRLKEEKILGRRREQNPKMNMGKYVSIVLATMCTKLAGQKWDELLLDDTIEREMNISTMWMPDVFYAYIWLRLQSMKKTLDMKLQSPYSGQEFDFVGDLKTVEVKVPVSLDACMWEYELIDPIKVREKQVTKLVLGPQRWNHIEQMGDVSIGAAKETVILASIHSLPEVQDTPIALAEDELDEMSKEDLETLSDRIDIHGFGPVMSLDAICPRTKRSFVVPIDWRFDNFFGISSRSPD
jgi:hypothetical protein